MKRLTLILLTVACAFTFAQAQNLKTPPVSKRASVSEWIGLTKVTINYHRPAVKGREIWGALVPYNNGVPFPWRAGANDNTTLKFADDVKIEGKDLPAGKYGFHIIPSEKEWILIFSNDNQAWGSFNYNPDHDALRISVEPQACEHVEWLKYEFVHLTDHSADVELSWEKKKISFTVDVDVNAVTMKSIEGQLTHLAGFRWQAWNQAAQYCLRTDKNLEQGLAWADRSISGGFGSQKNFTTLMTKAQILDKLDRGEEAKPIKEEAMTLATNAELNQYGYQLLNQGLTKEAVHVFELNSQNNPDDPNVWDSLGEGYLANGQKEEAIKSLKKSLSLNPAPNVKANSEKLLKLLGVSSDNE